VLFVAGEVIAGYPPPPPNIIIGTITINVSGTQPQHSVGLTWTERDPSVTGYNVLRSTTSGSGYVRINTAPVETVAYTDAGVSGSTTYFYVVTALSSGGESANSNQVTSVVPAP
jgi:fibronectin type 3 domain-containing protein